MTPFTFLGGADVDASIRAVAASPGAAWYAGGTTLVDLMKIDVVAPTRLVHVLDLPYDAITVDADGVHVGANVRNSDLAWHPEVCRRMPVLSEALLSGATTQLRNMATTAGNLRQRTRCAYFRDVHARCNKRAPGSGCDAMDGFNRGHAILGGSDHCIAVFPSDLCTALVVLDAVVRTRGADGSTRTIPFGSFHLAPGDTPHVETVLAHGELITQLDIPDPGWMKRSHYLKVRDRASYEFALASAAVALDVDDTGHIRRARVGLGGVATRPWRSPEAEQALVGQKPTTTVFRAAADAALQAASPRRHNQFKVELARRTLVRALTEVAALNP